MDTKTVNIEHAERDYGLSARRDLGILKDVHKAYEERMEIIERTAGANKLQRQAAVLRQWVVDLEGQNKLLARAVENLETEATDKLLLARRTREEANGESMRSLRRVNMAFSEELHALRRVCAALDDQCRTAAVRARFKDDIIKEMRRQLLHAKSELKKRLSGDHNYEHSVGASRSYEAVPKSCGRQPRTRKRDVPPADTPLHPDSDCDCCSPRLQGSHGDVLSAEGSTNDIEMK